MHDNGVTLQKKILENLDVKYSYELAKRMEQFKSHPILGYRPAGSKAEFATGEMLKTEMEALGLSDVTKDAVTVDGWEFHKATLRYENAARLLEAKRYLFGKQAEKIGLDCPYSHSTVAGGLLVTS